MDEPKTMPMLCWNCEWIPTQQEIFELNRKPINLYNCPKCDYQIDPFRILEYPERWARVKQLLKNRDIVTERFDGEHENAFGSDPDPASDNDVIQNFLDSRWRAAISSARETMESLREIIPELETHLPETAITSLESALSSVTRAYSSLHEAGKWVIGSNEYQEFLAAQTARRVGR
jgi:hypothetical protein